MKAAKDAGWEDNILEKNKTRLALWEEHLKDLIVALDKVALDEALTCVENLCASFFSS